MNKTRVIRWAGVGGLALLIFWGVTHRDAIAVSSVQAWLTGQGSWAAPLFVLAYAIGAVAFLPGSVMTLAGGAFFGPLQGTLLSLTGATLGATGSFLVARFLGGEWVTSKLGGRLEQLVRGIERDGWRFVAFVRLVPLFPFNVINYGLGLTRIRLVPYVVATALGMIPGAAGYAFVGHAGRAAASGTQTALQAGLIGLALLATTVFLLPRLARLLRPVKTIDVDGLRELLGRGQGVALIDVRARDEFCAPPGHIPGAACVPVDEIADRVDQLGGSDDEARVLVCRTDRRSTRAARILMGAGLSEVLVLAGGVDAWFGAGNPMSTCNSKETK
jgi:uncharacterized membrane protein YdjX (TVP38/TMEM64 family)/rhodanese-related sulfurtransferase